MLAVARKEILQVMRDPSSIIVAFVLPLVLIFIFGYALSLDNDDIAIDLVMEDTAPDAQSLTRAFVNSRYFRVEDVLRHRGEAQARLASGQVRGIVVIPQNFSLRLRTDGRPAELQVIADGSEPNTAAFVNNYAAGVLDGWMRVRGILEGERVGPPIEIESRVWYNPSLASRNVLVPGSIAVIMTLIGTLLTALVVAREWERGTMEALMATPVGIVELLIGKLIPYFALGLISMAICVGLALGVFGVPLRGSFSLLVLSTAVFLLAALGQGLFISSATKNQFVASQLAVISGFLPAFLLSGLIFEISSMPAPVQLLSHAVQARYFVTILRTLFLTGDVWPLLWPNLAAMLAIAVVFLTLSARATRKRLD
jgi:ABC-2 type transport system permease protein